MIALTLPDGAVREFDGPVSGFDVAKSISSSLAKKSFAIIVNGEVRDLSREIDTDATIEIVTKGHDEVLPLIRHDCAHVMAEAVQELYPDTQVTIGPSIENGFYYDFARATPFTPDDLVKIEKQMHKIIERNEPIVREVWDRNEAIKFFLDKGEKYNKTRYWFQQLLVLFYHYYIFQNISGRGRVPQRRCDVQKQWVKTQPLTERL